MITSDFWWPLSLSPDEEFATHAFNASMLEVAETVDLALLSSTAELLSQLMREHVGLILDRDGLPHLSHVINGWGNGRFSGRKMTEWMLAFIQRGERNDPFVIQCDPEGEFHPWQSFAYAVMAGVSADEELAPEAPSLCELAKTSRTLNTSDGHELGHLLFALAYLDPDLSGPPFRLTDCLLSPRELVAIAVEAHHRGSFTVCRKFHLTEGIAAMAALVPEMADYRVVAQGFINGQLDILFVLGAMLREVRIARGNEARYEPSSLLAKFRNSLIVGEFYENHVYYAGHLIELAAFAAMQGYEVTLAQRAAIAFVVNELNATLPQITARVSFPDCFLHFGHYRRAITLLAELEAVRWQAKLIGPKQIGRYTVDFDTVCSANLGTCGENAFSSVLDLGLYQLEKPATNPRKRFLEVVAAYEAIAQIGLEPRGGFDHFRRIGPPRWPRAFHYEILDYGDSIGLEIHMESDAVTQMAPTVRGLLPLVTKSMTHARVEWDASWWKSRGRLRAVYSDDIHVEHIARELASLIQFTFATLDREASTLPVSAITAKRLTTAPANELLTG